MSLHGASVRGAGSEEAKIQEDRERGTLAVFYPDASLIPSTPAEPDGQEKQNDPDIHVQVIPMEDKCETANKSHDEPMAVDIAAPMIDPNLLASVLNNRQLMQSLMSPGNPDNNHSTNPYP